MNTTTRPGGHLATELTPLRRWAALAVLSASLVVIAIDMTILNVALPHITADLAPTASQQLWIVDIYSLVLAGLLVPMSAVADRFGRRRILLTGFAVFASASLAVLVADGPATLIGIRALLGIGGAMIMPTTLSMIRVIFTDPKERATALGIWAAVSSVGMAAGPVIGGFVLEHGAWQWAFLINVPLMVAALVAGLFLLPEYRSPAPPRWDTAGTLAAMAGTTALVWSIKQFADEDFTDPLGWAVFTGSALALAWFVRRCLRRPDPMLDLRLFRRPPFTAGVLAALTFMFAMGALLLLIAQWLQLVEGRSPLEAGLSLLPAVVAVGIASPLAPLLATRIGARAVLGGGLATAGLGFLTIYLAPAPLSYAWAALALVLLGAGGSSLAVGSAIIMSGTPQEKAGNAAALEETSYELGSVLGVAILGSIAAAAFRSGMDLTTLTGYGLESAQAEAARESLGAAMAVAAETGSAPLAAQAADVFTDSLARTGLVGFVALLISAALVTALVPRSLDITRQSH